MKGFFFGELSIQNNLFFVLNQGEKKKGKRPKSQPRDIYTPTSKRPDF